MQRGIVCILSVALLSALPSLALEKGTGIVILNNDTLWRFRMVRETPEVVTPSGKIVHGGVKTDFENSTRIHSWFKGHPGEPTLPAERWSVRAVPDDKVRTLPGDTPPDWMKPEFDDGDWCRTRGPMLRGFFSTDENWKLILMRANFEVKNPERAGDLKLWISFRGGAVAYMNGEEVARAYMPDGPVTLSSPALPYPKEADYLDNGFTLPWGRQTTRGALARRPQEVKDRVAMRTRELSEATIPRTKLRKGVNTLAVALHRAPTPAARYVTRGKGGSSVSEDAWWSRLGLVSVALTAYPGPFVVPNIEPVREQRFQRWNHSIVQKVTIHDFPDPFETPNPVSIAGARNGSFSGQIVLGDSWAIHNLNVSVSDLRGPAVIPASAVQVRYGRPDGYKGSFDSLEESPPRSVLPAGKYKRAVQPVWFTVHVPAEAKPGAYAGTATIAAEDIEPRTCGLQLTVSDWTLPPTKEFVACMDIVQSPESVAMAYDVPLWSDKHFALLDRTFSLLGALADKTLYITCIRRTHFGNEHAMVRWIRDEDFELQPDFSIVERYLDTAMKHMGKIPGVILYCWEPPESQGHAGGTGRSGRVHDKPILFSLYDPETREYSAARGPAWGTPEAAAFWKKMTDGIQEVLEKRGLRDSMMFGLAGDHRPTRQAMDDICSGVPEAKWAIHSHYRCEEWQGYKMGMFIALWGIGCSPTDPTRGYGFGWSNPRWMSYYPRAMGPGSTLSEYRCILETWLGSRNGHWPFIATGYGARGLGRLVGDFWPVMKDSKGRERGTLAGRYPESAWGQLNLNFWAAPILARGRRGPIATVRSEAFRESAQQVEARVFLEKAWLDPASADILGKDLHARCRALLDERIRVVNVSARGGDADEAWFISSGWRDRAQRLFDMAGEVAAAYGNGTPKPDLSDRRKKEGKQP